MGPRNRPQKCEECQVGVGVTTGMSGDLVCLDCAEKQTRNASQMSNEITNVKKSGQLPSSNPLSDEQRLNQEVIFNALLSYVFFASRNSTIESIKLAVLGNFSTQDISAAKEKLWDKCDCSIIGEKQKRRDSCVRSEKEANIHDILAALIKLDNCGQVPSIAISATELHMIPRFNPEELVPSSVVERVQILENKFSQMINTLDRCLCENLELKDKIESNVSYAAVLMNNNIQSTAKSPSNSKKIQS